MQYFLAYLLLINAISLGIMLVDKRKAQQNLWRVPERQLLFFACIGGSLGILMGMQLFRHKTKHIKFTLGVPCILAIQIVAILCLYMFIKK